MKKIETNQRNEDRWVPDALTAWVMSDNQKRIEGIIRKEGAKSAQVIAEKLAKDLKNPSVAGSTSGIDLVVEEIQVKGGNFKLREGASFVVRVKNRGEQALAKEVPVPLTIKMEGMGMRVDMESYTFKDGIAPGETISVVKNNNGPWTGNLGWTAENAGNYTMEISLDSKATITESNRGNNQFKQAITVNNTSTLSSYMVEKIFRAGATEWSGNQVVDHLRLITNPESMAMGVALKGAAGTWNTKKAAELLAENKAYFMDLAKVIRPQDVEMWERLANAWKLEIPSTASKGPIVRITMQTIKEAMKYSPATFSVPAGATVELIFENVDAMQHNWVLGAMGSQEKIGLAADKMITAADGAAKNYIPALPEVLAYTPLVESDGRVKVVFKAPTVPGDYPFLCTFPGHWRIMNGVMTVK